jgi:hypothetical protein
VKEHVLKHATFEHYQKIIAASNALAKAAGTDEAEKNGKK